MGYDENDGKDVLNGTDDEDRRTIAQRTAEAAEAARNGDEDDRAELFPLGSLEGDGATPQKMIDKRLPIELTVSIGRAEVPLLNGMVSPNKTGRALVSYRFHKNEDIAVIEDGEVVGWKVRQHLKATNVAQANDEEALIRSEFAALTALSATRAAALHEELGRQLTAELAAA